VPQAFDLSGITNTMGGPSFAFSANGGTGGSAPESRANGRGCELCPEEAIAGSTSGDKVQVMGAVRTMQAAGRNQQPWYKQRRTRPCKKRKDGAPAVQERKRKTLKGWATRLLRMQKGSSLQQRRPGSVYEKLRRRPSDQRPIFDGGQLCFHHGVGLQQQSRYGPE